MSTDIKRAQNTLLNMSAKIARVFEKNNIPYMIAYGTLLGAVRHEGFIPWDDDFDFFVFDDNYDKGIECLRRELPENMFVEDEQSEPLYFHAWAHVKDLNSAAECALFPQDSLYSHKGLSVDLYRMKKVSQSDLFEWFYNETEAYIERRKSKGLISAEEYESRIKSLNSKRTAENPYKQSDKKVFAMPINYEYLEENDVFPLKKVKFENTFFYAPNHPDVMLKKLYGDYMTLPKEDDRHGHYTKIEFK